MAYRTPTYDIMHPHPWNIEPLSMVFLPPTHGISNNLPMVYRAHYPWYIEPPIQDISNTHGILNPSYPWHIESPTHSISIPLPIGALTSQSMVYRNHYPWYIELLLMVYRTHFQAILNPLRTVCRTPTNDISIPLPTVYGTPYPWYFDPPTHAISEPLFMVY
jgi:hypothetical protein